MTRRSLAAVRPPQWRTGRKNAWPNLPLVPHPHRRKTADPSRGRNVQPPAQSRVQGLAHGLDQLLKISGFRKRQALL